MHVEQKGVRMPVERITVRGAGPLSVTALSAPRGTYPLSQWTS